MHRTRSGTPRNGIVCQLECVHVSVRIGVDFQNLMGSHLIVCIGFLWWQIPQKCQTFFSKYFLIFGLSILFQKHRHRHAFLYRHKYNRNLDTHFRLPEKSLYEKTLVFGLSGPMKCLTEGPTWILASFPTLQCFGERHGLQNRTSASAKKRV